MPQIRDLDDCALLSEWWFWDHKIRTATSWGGALGAANEFRKDCEAEIARRNRAYEESR